MRECVILCMSGEYDYNIPPLSLPVQMIMSHFPWAQKTMQLAFGEDAQGLQAQFRAILQSIHPELFVTTRIKRLEEKALKEGQMYEFYCNSQLYPCLLSPFLLPPPSLPLSLSLSLSSWNVIYILLLNSGNRPDRIMCSFQVVAEDALLPSK